MVVAFKGWSWKSRQMVDGGYDDLMTMTRHTAGPFHPAAMVCLLTDLHTVAMLLRSTDTEGDL